MISDRAARTAQGCTGSGGSAALPPTSVAAARAGTGTATSPGRPRRVNVSRVNFGRVNFGRVNVGRVNVGRVDVTGS
jgi:hypothetical protein